MREKLKVEEIIIVEGKYDKIALDRVVDGTVITTRGFGIFKDKELRALVRKLAAERGVVILTDSDGAGMVIRNHLRSILSGFGVKHAYIKPTHGKERRKQGKSAEGLLGVEGIEAAELREALEKAGVSTGIVEDKPSGTITKAVLYSWGLSGGVESAIKREKLALKLGLPKNLSAKALCEVLSILYSIEQLEDIITDISH